MASSTKHNKQINYATAAAGGGNHNVATPAAAGASSTTTNAAAAASTAAQNAQRLEVEALEAIFGSDFQTVKEPWYIIC
jgi:hypothetical protein